MERDSRMAQVEKLFEEFELGKISRRNLIRGLTGVGVLSAITGSGSARAQGLASEPGASVERSRDPGRKVLLERIMNHTFDYVDGNHVELHGKSGKIVTAMSPNPSDPVLVTTKDEHELKSGDLVDISGLENSPINDKRWFITRKTSKSFSLDDSPSDETKYENGKWEQPCKVFSTAREHQGWLFGTDGDYKNKGLLQYKDDLVKDNRHALTTNIGSSGDRKRRHKGVDICTSRAPDNLEDCVAKANTNIDLYFAGNEESLGDDYDFDDLYGLVRAKLHFICNHCKEESLKLTLAFLLKASENVKCSGEDLNAEIRNLLDEQWSEFIDYIEPYRDSQTYKVDWNEVCRVLTMSPEQLQKRPGTLDVHGDY